MSRATLLVKTPSRPDFGMARNPSGAVANAAASDAMRATESSFKFSLKSACFWSRSDVVVAASKVGRRAVPSRLFTLELFFGLHISDNFFCKRESFKRSTESKFTLKKNKSTNLNVRFNRRFSGHRFRSLIRGTVGLKIYSTLKRH